MAKITREGYYQKDPLRVQRGRDLAFRRYYDLPSATFLDDVTSQFYDDDGDFITGQEKEYRKMFRWTGGVIYQNVEDFLNVYEARQGKRAQRFESIAAEIKNIFRDACPKNGSYSTNELWNSIDVEGDENDNAVIVSMNYYGYLLNAGIQPHVIEPRARSGLRSAYGTVRVARIERTIVTTAYGQEGRGSATFRGYSAATRSYAGATESVYLPFRSRSGGEASKLVFYWEKVGRKVGFVLVNHPGTMMYEGWIQSAVDDPRTVSVLDAPPRPRIDFQAIESDESTTSRSN